MAAGEVEVFDEASTRAALTKAREQAGVDVADARLVRLGENAVFQVGENVVARVGRSHAELASVERSIRVAPWLEAEDFPAVRTLDVDQPVDAGGHLVTFWCSLGDADRYGTAAQLGSLLRRLHGVALPAELGLPALDPFERTRRRIETAQISGPFIAAAQ